MNLSSVNEMKNLNTSGILNNVGTLASVNITGIIPATQTQIKPTIAPLDLCKTQGDPTTAAKLQSWVSSLGK
jgi:hypothetical protein